MKNIDRLDKLIGTVVICFVVIAALIIGFRLWFKKKEAAPVPRKDATVQKTQPLPAVLDYNKLGKDAELNILMQQRKEAYGIKKGLDMIAKPEESLKIGDTTVSMREILEKIQLEKGKIVEKEISQPREPQDRRKAAAKPQSPITQDVYGIYVVQSGDNIWNIHFQFLKEYFEHRGISLAPLADEPDKRGLSSGVGKLLKFSENMVYIYNIRERKIDVNLNLIQPLTKIIVFRMKQVFTLLDQIDYPHVNRIQFDGETLWVPANQ